MSITEFLADYGSTTTHFKQMSDKYELKILQHGVVGDKFERLVIIYVADLPVMFGLSVTNLSSPTFLNILQNARTVPIGVKLFAAGTAIIRTNMIIKQIDVALVENYIISKYLQENKISGQIYYRQSDFVNGAETMQLKEYILPGLLELLSKNTK